MQPLTLGDIRKQVTVVNRLHLMFEPIVLFALYEVGVFETLADGPQTLAELHSTLGGDLESLRATMDAAVAMELLELDGARYSAGEDLLDCLGRRDSSAFLGEWLAFIHALATPLLRLGEEIREGSKPGALFEDMHEANLPAKRMTEAMDAYARSRGAEMVDYVDFSETRRLIDVGCGSGTYALAVVEKHPQIEATLLDLPGPIAEAKRIMEQRGVSERFEFVAMDAMSYRTEEPFDTVLLSNTLHMIGEQGSLALLEHCASLLSPGGRIVVQAQYLNDDRTTPVWPTQLNLIQRVATPAGRNHAKGETGEWLRKAGFVDVEYVRFSAWNACSCLVGRIPANERRDGQAVAPQ